MGTLLQYKKELCSRSFCTSKDCGNGATSAYICGMGVVGCQSASSLVIKYYFLTGRCSCLTGQLSTYVSKSLSKTSVIKLIPGVWGPSCKPSPL